MAGKNVEEPKEFRNCHGEKELGVFLQQIHATIFATQVELLEYKEKVTVRLNSCLKQSSSTSFREAKGTSS